MADRSITRRDFFHQFVPEPDGVQVEQVSPEQADLTAANFPETEFTHIGRIVEEKVIETIKKNISSGNTTINASGENERAGCSTNNKKDTDTLTSVIV